MGKQSKGPCREDVLRQLCRLAGVKFNDPVRLAYLTQEQADQIREMDLSALKEFKRHANGAVEMKLTDRVEVLEKVMRLLDGGEDAGVKALLAALQPPGPPEEGEENG